MDPDLVEVVFRVEANYAGWRLDLYLCDKIRRLSRTRVQRIIKESLRHDEPRPLKPSTQVWPGLEVRLLRRREPEPEGPRTYQVAFEDEDVLVVDKPAGLTVHPSARWLVSTLTAVLRERQPPGEKWDIAHRLDRETSGLVVCGKRPEVTRKLKMLFERQGMVRKEYLALVHGWPPEDAFPIDLPLALLDHPLRVKMGVDHGPAGKQARTDVRVERRFRKDVPWRGPELSLLRCFPRTGRQHQLRVHLAQSGHPVVGDKIYGPDERFFVEFAEGRLDEAARLLLVLPRHALHAAAIELPHPMHGRPLRVEAALPGDMADLMAGPSVGAGSTAA